MLPVAFALLLPALLADPAGALDPISPAEFERLHALIKPALAAYETIPWRTDLLAARREAVAAGKPLFLWTMNGHPLGCT